jgi:GTP pyrophosphokinase
LRGKALRERPRPRRGAKKKPGQPDTDAVSGIGDLMCNFARCCRPVPPESIVGYITQGRGVTIHRQDCGNFLGLSRRYPERIVEIGWGRQDSGAYPVDLTLYAFDRSGLIRDITSVLADENANVLDLKSHTDKETMQVVMHISIEISDLPSLSTAITRLEQISNVVSVTRDKQ